MASFFTRRRPHLFSWWSLLTAMYHPFLRYLDLYPDLIMTGESLSLGSHRSDVVISRFWDVCTYLCEVLRKVILSVKELLNIKLFFCAKAIMTSNMKNMAVEVKDWSEHKTWNRQIKIATLFGKTVDPHMKTMIQSDQLTVAEVLLSDWLKCRSEGQGESNTGSDETEWSEEEDGADFAISQMSYESRELWESFVNSDPYNPFQFYCSTEDVKASGGNEYDVEEELIPSGYQSKDETAWSDEKDSMMSSENRELWESFLNNRDPYNPFQLYSSTEDKVKASGNDYKEEEAKEKFVPCPLEKDETEWSEDEEDGDLEMSPENQALWESFNSDPYNPLCFSCPTGVKIKASELQHDITPSSPTASEENNQKQCTKERARKVKFNEEITIHNLEAWGSASQEARDGSCWLELARDRERFRRRVEETSKTISPCLLPQHRNRVLARLLSH